MQTSKQVGLNFHSRLVPSMQVWQLSRRRRSGFSDAARKPEQSVPLPSKPVLQPHVKLPTVL
jgi:hypothetical protein